MCILYKLCGIKPVATCVAHMYQLYLYHTQGSVEARGQTRQIYRSKYLCIPILIMQTRVCRVAVPLVAVISYGF